MKPRLITLTRERRDGTFVAMVKVAGGMAMTILRQSPFNDRKAARRWAQSEKHRLIATGEYA